MSAVSSQDGLTDLLPCTEHCGARYSQYSFGQTDREVTVIVPLEPGTTSKMVQVEITATHLKIAVKGKGTVLNGVLHKPVKASESTWCIQDRKELVITLVKTNLKFEEWWPLVVEGEKQMDLKTLKPPAVRFSELDDGAQATISRMMFDQRQKRAGLPTSGESQCQVPFPH